MITIISVNHRQGHSVNCRGAKAIVDEVDVCSQINKYLSEYLTKEKVNHLDCTSTESNVNADLNYGVNKNNNNKKDYFVSLHANATIGGYGCEIWLHPSTSQANKNTATRILQKLSTLGFKNRGLKYSSGLYELRATNNMAMIVENFFVDSQSDVNIYKKVGAKAMAKAIAEGLLNKTITESTNTQKPNNNKKGVYRVVCGSYGDKKNAIDQQNSLKAKGFDSFLVYEVV